MGKLIAGGHFVHMDNDTVWPTPMDDPDGGLEWRLRYAPVEELWKDRFRAASVVSAYRHLMQLPVRYRNKVIAEIKRTQQDPKRGSPPFPEVEAAGGGSNAPVVKHDAGGSDV